MPEKKKRKRPAVSVKTDSDPRDLAHARLKQLCDAGTISKDDLPDTFKLATIHVRMPVAWYPKRKKEGSYRGEGSFYILRGSNDLNSRRWTQLAAKARADGGSLEDYVTGFDETVTVTLPTAKAEEKPVPGEFDAALAAAMKKQTIMIDKEQIEHFRALTPGRTRQSQVKRTVKRHPDLGTATVTYMVTHATHSVGFVLELPLPLREEQLKNLPQGGPALRDTAFALLGFAEEQGTFRLRLRRSDLLEMSRKKKTTKEYRLQDARLLQLFSKMFVRENNKKGKAYRKHFGHFINDLLYVGKGRGSWLEVEINPRMAKAIAADIKGEIPEDFRRLPTKQMKFHFGYKREFLDYLLLWQGDWRPYPKLLATVYREAWGIDAKVIGKKGIKWALDVLKESLETASGRGFGWTFVFDRTGTELDRKLSLPEFKAYMKLDARETPWDAWQRVQEYAKKKALPEKVLKNLRELRTGFDLLEWKILFLPPEKPKKLKAPGTYVLTET
jgi:hypothetical protein